ncbi:hypothetical protein GDO86_011599 [Hymenochirus boettgeri]|uniref:Uncharacterized protein n=1 Tax=Hymenochirus boettgeri TaxID=247094 RepID=A0A8T2JH25_9PIPI|nr:hypothetical protein GDO86_011599 [Hymenochirus boettgeri]
MIIAILKGLQRSPVTREDSVFYMEASVGCIFLQVSKEKKSLKVQSNMQETL